MTTDPSDMWAFDEAEDEEFFKMATEAEGQSDDQLTEACELIADLRNALARERGGGSPLDPVSYRLLHRMAGDFLARGAEIR